MEWTETHNYLQLIMKRELETLRQLLENMNLEEQFIVRKEKQYWNAMMEERNQLHQQLQIIRKDRIAATEKLEAIAHQENASLEELLPVQDTNSWEILLLRDQTATLLDRINLQTSRNEMLVQLIRTPTPLPQSKKKIGLATLPSEDYKEEDA